MKLVVQQPGAREIKVKLMLAGGHSAMSVVPPEHALLAQLLAAVASPPSSAAERQPTIFQIPVDGGRASLAFASHQLIGVLTDPAVLVEQDGRAAPTSVAQAAGATSDATSGSLAKPGWGASGDIVRHPIVQLDEFLTAAEVAWLMDLVFAAEHRFVPSSVSDSKDDYRHSFVLNPPGELAQMMSAKIRQVMPEVIPRLKMAPFPVGEIECQVTANSDGSFFRVHTDAGVNETVKRQFTYVYYFNREPKGFAGGQLRIYDDQIRNGKLARTESYQTVEPRHNSIVFFQAAVMHEVVRVDVPSKQFRDSRFTVNGWIHRV